MQQARRPIKATVPNKSGSALAEPVRRRSSTPLRGVNPLTPIMPKFKKKCQEGGDQQPFPFFSSSFPSSLCAFAPLRPLREELQVKSRRRRRRGFLLFASSPR